MCEETSNLLEAKKSDWLNPAHAGLKSFMIVKRSSEKSWEGGDDSKQETDRRHVFAQSSCGMGTKHYAPRNTSKMYANMQTTHAAAVFDRNEGHHHGMNVVA
jgi:hypothetical protein